jgi:hypothetical protein
MASENSTVIYNLHGMLIVCFHVSIWTPWGRDALCAIRSFLVLPGLISAALPHVLIVFICYLILSGGNSARYFQNLPEHIVEELYLRGFTWTEVSAQFSQKPASLFCPEPDESSPWTYMGNRIGRHVASCVCFAVSINFLSRSSD